jgi:hypothetical protein
LRSWSVDAGVRKWGWLPVDLSTGRRELAGLGMADGRGIAEGCWSMAGSVQWAHREVVATSMGIFSCRLKTKSISTPRDTGTSNCMCTD